MVHVKNYETRHVSKFVKSYSEKTVNTFSGHITSYRTYYHNTHRTFEALCTPSFKVKLLDLKIHLNGVSRLTKRKTKISALL